MLILLWSERPKYLFENGDIVEEEDFVLGVHTADPTSSCLRSNWEKTLFQKLHVISLHEVTFRTVPPIS